MDYEKLMEQTIGHIEKDKLQYTDNGALVYKPEELKNPFLELLAVVRDLREPLPTQYIDKYKKLLYRMFEADYLLACKMLWYIRDIKQGLGERNAFRTLVSLLPDYLISRMMTRVNIQDDCARYDDFIELYLMTGNKYIEELLCLWLSSDLTFFAYSTEQTLISKWMPSINTSSRVTRSKARRMFKILSKSLAIHVSIMSNVSKELDSDVSEPNMSILELLPKNVLKNPNSIDDNIEIIYKAMNDALYRKVLSKLRKRLNLVETKMSGCDWELVNYSTVPARAFYKYKDAFMRHDYQRFNEFLLDANSKIHQGTMSLGMYSKKYLNLKYYDAATTVDPVVEKMWNDFVEEQKEKMGNVFDEVLIMRDGSGSMYSTNAISVANDATALSLALNTNPVFKNKFLTFSSMPTLVDLSDAKSFCEQIKIMTTEDDCSNTNIFIAFRTILDVAMASANGTETKINDIIPKKLIVISDMQFDGAHFGFNLALFNQIKAYYHSNHAELPEVIFWNVARKCSGIPMVENKNGLFYIQGDAPSILELILTNHFKDAFEILKKTLNENERYTMEEELSSK